MQAELALRRRMCAFLKCVFCVEYRSEKKISRCRRTAFTTQDTKRCTSDPGTPNPLVSFSHQRGSTVTSTLSPNPLGGQKGQTRKTMKGMNLNPLLKLLNVPLIPCLNVARILRSTAHPTKRGVDRKAIQGCERCGLFSLRRYLTFSKL